MIMVLYISVVFVFLYTLGLFGYSLYKPYLSIALLYL